MKHNSILIFNELYFLSNDPSYVKLGRAVTFIKYLASARAVSLIFLPKTLILNKIAFLPSNSLKLAKLFVNKLKNTILENN